MGVQRLSQVQAVRRLSAPLWFLVSTRYKRILLRITWARSHPEMLRVAGVLLLLIHDRT